MANEVNVRTALTIRKGVLDYRSNPQTFNADMVTNSPKGSCPGSFTATLEGVAANLTELTTPGYGWMQNLDSTNYVEWGIRDPATDAFYPLGELAPGETQVIHFSRNLLESYTNTGTGTTGSVNQLWFKANQAACNIMLHAFER